MLCKLRRLILWMQHGHLLMIVVLMCLTTWDVTFGYLSGNGDTQGYHTNHYYQRSTTTTTTTAAAENEELVPKFLSRQRFISVYKGAMATLPCEVQYLGDRQVVWRRMETDEFLTIGRMVWSKDPRLVLEARTPPGDVSSWNLLLRNAQYDDAGLYECQVTSSEHLTWEMRLVVLEPVSTPKPKPRVHKKVTQSSISTAQVQSAEHKYVSHVQEFVASDLPIRLVCSTSLGNQSVPLARLEWFKDGVKLQSNARILLTLYQFESNRTYVSQLLIDRARISDTGKYVCKMMSEELLVAKIFVNPRNSKSSPKREDRSQHYNSNVDTLKAENAAPTLRYHFIFLTSVIAVTSFLTRFTLLCKTLPFDGTCANSCTRKYPT